MIAPPSSDQADPASRAQTPPALRALQVAAATAVAYAAIAALALLLAGPPAYASPLYPSSGLALAAVLVYGRAALPGVLLGAALANLGLSGLRGQPLISLLPVAIGCGAALQAAVGAFLVRRFVATPLVMQAPRDVFLTALHGALLACTVSPTVATAALWASGVLQADSLAGTWLTWWLGDALGVLIALPMAMTLIGRPAADWQPRRLTLGLPMAAALTLLAAGMAEIGHVERQRQLARFERDASRLANAAQQRLAAPLYALQALHGAARADGELDAARLRATAHWWLAQPLHLQAMGHSVRVPLDALPAFEVGLRLEALEAAPEPAPARVFDRDQGQARAADGEVLVLRQVEPRAANRAALGLNVLSVPAARQAILASRDSGQPAASAGFVLTQARSGERGVVLYQALYRPGNTTPATVPHRREAFASVVFVTLDTGRTMEGLAAEDQSYLAWCLVDPTPGVRLARLAGPDDCEAWPASVDVAQDPAAAKGAATAPGRTWGLTLPLQLVDRPLELRLRAAADAIPGRAPETAWLLASVGLAATALLGALLLTVTGQSRRTELAVEAATGALRREMGERARAQQALRDSELRLRSILDHLPVGVVFLDPDGRILDCNPRGSEILGRDAEDLRGSLVTAYLDAATQTQARRQRRELLSGAEVVSTVTLRMAGRDGRLRQLRVGASPLRDPQGRLQRIVCVLEDVTEHLRLQASERALQQAQAASQAKSEFVSRMSHELRTPLNAMLGFSQLLGLDQRPALAAHQQEWTQQILRAGWHLLDMINETLDLARIESGAVRLQPESVDVAALVAACRALVESGVAARGLVLQEALSADAGAVRADPTRLKQVLSNLLSNAVKYNRDGGQVTISSVREADGRVRIEVTDTGLGLDADQMAHLFEPYNRLGREHSGIEGTGIGLAISHRLTELMQGTLRAHSVPGVGSTFTVVLPAGVEPVRAPEDLAPIGPSAYHARRVHYIEDNETNIEIMRGVLALRPQIALTTSLQGLQGLDAVRRHPPDLILLDMQLPDIDGLTLLREFKHDPDLAAVPVVVVSADANPSHMQQALTLGAQHYVTKPLDMPRFLALVDAVLDATDTQWGSP